MHEVVLERATVNEAMFSTRSNFDRAFRIQCLVSVAENATLNDQSFVLDSLRQRQLMLPQIPRGLVLIFASLSHRPIMPKGQVVLSH